MISHVFLWRSEMAPGLKLTFTMINAVGWTIVFAPIVLVDRWLETIKARNSETSNDL
ncbi:hypothetical protein [Tateyamaria pelophila]|uniref:hypothetical protein n=1 Tax=Tateyamaria pelophila TaxID=328415 RepID=UPI001CBA942E|nr:hypothetical protein [Tateyamaria pelophila]